MPRINLIIKIILEHNLQPSFMHPRHDKNPIGRSTADRLSRECVELVHPGAVSEMISQLQRRSWSQIRNIVHSIAPDAVDQSSRSVEDKRLRQCHVRHVESALRIRPRSASSQIPPSRAKHTT